MSTAAATETETEVNSGKRRPGLQEQRNIVLSAAIDLFSERGCRAVSISQVCKQAGVSRDTYYRCFTDKESLIDHLYQTAVNDHMETVMGSWDLDFNNPEWLHQAFDKTIDAILEDHKIARFLFVESADPNSHAYRVIHKAYDKVVKRMQRWSKDTNGSTPSREYLLSVLVASQWLVHNAIIAGMGKRDVNKAKLAGEQLFYAVFSSMDRSSTI